MILGAGLATFRAKADFLAGIVYREAATVDYGPGYADSRSVATAHLPSRSPRDVEIMSANASIEEIRAELAKLKLAYEVLEKSHRRLIAKVLPDKSEADHFAGQMVIDRTMLTPPWLKGR